MDTALVGEDTDLLILLCYHVSLDIPTNGDAHSIDLIVNIIHDLATVYLDIPY